MKRAGLLVVAAAGLFGSVSCTASNAQGNSSPVRLLIATINGGLPLLSDVSAGGTVTADIVNVTVANRAKNPFVNTPQVSMAVILRNYTVRYIRSDGRTEVGVDVPTPISGPAVGAVDVADSGQNVDIPVEVVRIQQKLEPPLRNLRGAVPDSLGGSTIVLTVIAEVCLFGETVAGQVVSDCGNLQIDFADFGA